MAICDRKFSCQELKHDNLYDSIIVHYKALIYGQSVLI